MSKRPDVPMPVQRLLRQEAGFGCCKCGAPIYEYHHIIPYEVEPHFRPEDMMLLYPGIHCHTKATQKAMSEEEQRQYKAQPYNICRGYTQGLLAIEQRTLTVSFGTVQFTGRGTFFQVDDTPLLGLDLSDDG